MNKRINTIIELKLLRAAQQLAALRGMSVSDIVRLAIRDYVQTELVKERERLDTSLNT